MVGAWPQEGSHRRQRLGHVLFAVAAAALVLAVARESQSGGRAGKGK